MKDTVVGWLSHWSNKTPREVAFRQKKFGIWHTVTWESFHNQVMAFAQGLVCLGMKPGDKLSIIGDNAGEWVIAELAAMRLGGACIGIYPDMLIEEVVHLVNTSESRILVVSDQEQVDKVLEIWDRIKDHVVKVVVWDSRGMTHYFRQHSFLIHFKEVIDSKRPNETDSSLSDISLSPDLPVLMLPTSGTTGLPKLPITTHETILNGAKLWNSVHPYYQWDELFALLPLSWMGEQFAVIHWLIAGCRYNFPESQASVKADFRECQPTVIVMSPRMWEDICSDVRARMEDASFFKKIIYNYSLKLGLFYAERSLEGSKKLPFLKKWIYAFAMSTTLRSLLQRVGLARIRIGISGGAAIGREVFTFYMALGTNLMQMYGLTECGIATCHCSDDVRPETVGKPLPGVHIKLDDDGMVYIKSPATFAGYLNSPEKTSEVLKDGWFKTGDSGYYDEYGHFVILDRYEDLMFLKKGTKFSPQDLENRLKFSPYITQTVIFGDKRDIITAMICIDMENVGNWANKRNVPYTTFTDLSQNDSVTDLIAEEVRKINGRLPKEIRVRRFLLLPKELHPDDGELTRTRKIKRNVINQRYGEMIKALYSGAKGYDLDLGIKYMDGKTSRLKSHVRLEDL